MEAAAREEQEERERKESGVGGLLRRAASSSAGAFRLRVQSIADLLNQWALHRVILSFPFASLHPPVPCAVLRNKAAVAEAAALRPFRDPRVDARGRDDTLLASRVHTILSRMQQPGPPQ